MKRLRGLLGEESKEEEEQDEFGNRGSLMIGSAGIA